MPYVKKERRPLLLGGLHGEGAGDLNFLITGALITNSPFLRDELVQIGRRWIQEEQACGAFRYQTINDVLGALFAANMEYVRRVGDIPEGMLEAVGQAGGLIYAEFAGNYEDQKIAENGDVYPASLIDGLRAR